MFVENVDIFTQASQEKGRSFPARQMVVFVKMFRPRPEKSGGVGCMPKRGVAKVVQAGTGGRRDSPLATLLLVLEIWLPSHSPIFYLLDSKTF